MEQAHCGHLCTSKMKQIFVNYSLSIIDDYIWYSNSCLHFSKCNKPAPLATVANDIKECWDTISLDFTSPSAKLQGNILLTCIDYHSHFPFEFIVNSASASNVVSALQSLFNMFVVVNMHIVVTDNGSSFVSGELDKFLKQQGISHHTSSVYNPVSNGVVEWMHHTLKNHLQKLLFDGMPFTTALQEVLFSMRSNNHDAIRQLPFSRFFGPECWTSFSILSNPALVRSSPCNYKCIYNWKDSSGCAKVISFQLGDQVVWWHGMQRIFAERATVRSKVGWSTYILQSPEGSKSTFH